MPRTPEEIRRAYALMYPMGAPIQTGDPTNTQLASTIRQRLLESGEDESILDKGKGLLARGFDVLARPLYAVDNVLEDYINRNAARSEEAKQEGQSYLERLPGSILEFLDLRNAPEQLWQGLSGQEKVTGANLVDRLQETSGRELPGPAQFAADMALDVAFDPLTYTGLNVVKKLPEEAITAQAGQAYQLAKEEGGLLGSSLSKEATSAARRELAREGLRPLVSANVESGVRRTRSELIRERFGEIKDAYIENEALNRRGNLINKLREENPGTVGLRIGNTGLGPSSRSLYDLGSKIGSKTADTALGRTINNSFRTGSRFVAGTNQTIRRIFSSGAAEGDNLLRLMDEGGRFTDRYGTQRELPGFRSLDVDDAEEITRSIEGGYEVPQLTDHIEATKTINRGMYAKEEGIIPMGNLDSALRKPHQEVENFMPIAFKKNSGQELEQAAFMTKRKKQIDDAIEERHNIATERGNAEKESVKAGGGDEAAQKAAFNQGYAAYRDSHPIVTTYTSDMAKNLGLDPIQDVRYLMAQEVWDHTSRVSRAKIANDVGSEFGVKINPKDTTTAAMLNVVPTKNRNLPRDIHFPKEIEKSMKRLDEIVHQGHPDGDTLLDLYDKGLGQLKFFQTVVSPGHHIRNAMTDMTHNFLDGVNTVEPYTLATRMLGKTKGGQAVLGRNFEQIIEGLDDVLVDVGGRQFDGNQIMSYFNESGARAGQIRSEVLTKPGSLQGRVREVSELREDWARLAHFIDAFQKEGADLAAGATQTQIKAATERAAARVRKYNIDYGDLTPFEQKTMKRIIPFYTFMRKNTPLQLETLLTRPGRGTIAPKVVRNLQNELGQDNENMNLFGINTLPQYVQDMMGVRIPGETDGSGAAGNYWDPAGMFSVYGVDDLIGHGTEQGLPNPMEIFENLVGQSTPIFQIPEEMRTGQSAFTGRSTDSGVMEKLMNTTSLGRTAYENFFSDEPSDPQRRILNFLTGAGIQTVNEGSIAGELRSSEDVIDARIRERQERAQELLRQLLQQPQQFNG